MTSTYLMIILIDFGSNLFYPDGDQGPAQSLKHRKVTSPDLALLATRCASKWKKIARFLRKRDRRHRDQQPAFDEEALRQIERGQSTDEERLIVMLDKWLSMHPLHHWDMLWAALVEAGLMAIADEVLHRNDDLHH